MTGFPQNGTIWAKVSAPMLTYSQVRSASVFGVHPALHHFAKVLPTGIFSLFADCGGGGSFLGFPTWYTYLPCTNGQPSIVHLADVWLIVAAVIEILLRVVSIAAVGYIVWGGIQYMISQGEPDKTAKAQGTIINAAIGLVVAVASAAVVSYIAGRFAG